YSTVEEAIETRNAVYNLQWPPNGGRLLVAEYVDPQEVQMKLGPPPHVAVNNDSTVPPETPTSLPEPPIPVTFPPPPPLSRLPPAAREWLPPPPHLSEPLPTARERLPPPPLSELPPAAREWLPLPASIPEKVDQPIRTIDDVFRKTIATPQIYYLPLSEEQVAAKLAALSRSVKQ
ncbi:apoptotic chromatin condensation inducer in the nucleus, partial [Trifolium medium]|nr:apoptotic chromatin condensation inducer in the nucleus [Trifolium medium]